MVEETKNIKNMEKEKLMETKKEIKNVINQKGKQINIIQNNKKSYDIIENIIMKKDEKKYTIIPSKKKNCDTNKFIIRLLLFSINSEGMLIIHGASTLT